MSWTTSLGYGQRHSQNDNNPSNKTWVNLQPDITRKIKRKKYINLTSSVTDYTFIL